MKKYFESLKYFLFLCVILNFSIKLNATEKDTTLNSIPNSGSLTPRGGKINSENVFVGGSLGGGFSGNAGMFQISPIVGYSFTDYFQSGIRGSYTYIYGTERYTNYRYSDNIFSASLINRLIVYEGIFLQIEPELMNRNAYSVKTNALGVDELTYNRVSVFNFYVGGGAYLDFSSNTGAFLLLLYNLNQNENSFNRNPHIQGGVIFGF